MFRIATAAYSCCPLCSDSSRSCASCSLTAPMQAPSSTTVPPQRCAVWWSRLSNALMAPRALSSNPSVGSLSAPLPGSIAAGGSPRTGKTATTMHSPSSASPPSASCSDGSVILHEVFGRTLKVAPDADQPAVVLTTVKDTPSGRPQNGPSLTAAARDGRLVCVGSDLQTLIPALIVDR